VPDFDTLLTTCEVADILSVCPETVRQLADRGELPVIAYNGPTRRILRFERAVVIAYRKRCCQSAARPDDLRAAGRRLFDGLRPEN